MKILFIAPRYTGGTGVHITRVAKKLVQHGFDVRLMRVPHIPVKGLKNPSFGVFALLKAVTDREEYDVVHAFNVPSAPAMRYVRAKRRVLGLLGVYSDQIGMIHSSAAARLARAAERKAIGWADRITTDSMDVKRTYREKLGVDVDFFFGPIDTAEFDSLGEVQKVKNQIAYIGRDSPEKGIDILRGIEPRLDGRVVYCTDVSWRDAMMTLKASSVLVVPSRIESSPQVIKEAFYLGVPVVATSVGGVPELIEDGTSGILVPPENPERLREAINSLLGDEKTAGTLARNGYRTAIEKLTWDSLLPEYIRFYEDLAAHDRHG